MLRDLVVKLRVDRASKRAGAQRKLLLRKLEPDKVYSTLIVRDPPAGLRALLARFRVAPKLRDARPTPPKAPKPAAPSTSWSDDEATPTTPATAYGTPASSPRGGGAPPKEKKLGTKAAKKKRQKERKKAAALRAAAARAAAPDIPERGAAPPADSDDESSSSSSSSDGERFFDARSPAPEAVSRELPPPPVVEAPAEAPADDGWAAVPAKKKREKRPAASVESRRIGALARDVELDDE